MARVSRGRADRIQSRNGHVADDPNCEYWYGDFAGVRLDAVCPLCAEGYQPPQSESRPIRSNWDNRDALGLLLLATGLLLTLALMARWLL